MNEDEAEPENVKGKKQKAGHVSSSKPRRRRRLESQFDTLPLPAYEDILDSPEKGSLSVSTKGNTTSSPEKKQTYEEVSDVLIYNGCDEQNPRFKQMVRDVRQNKRSISSAIKEMLKDE